MIARLHGHKRKFLAIIALALIMAAGFGIREAISADADLQQYNGTAVWENDLTSASTLLPRDGKRITADSNAVGSAPVNRSLKQIKDLLIGLHDATIGSRAGATRRTFKSIDVDGTGGVASPLAPGLISTATANDGVVLDPTYITVFKIDPMGGEATLNKKELKFINTVDGGGNPLKTAPNSNKVMPLNTAKVWVSISTSGGVIFHNDGFNVTSVALSAGNKITINFASNFDNTLYACIAPAATGVGPSAVTGVIDPADKAVGSVKITYGVDPASVDIDQYVVCFGRQTT